MPTPEGPSSWEEPKAAHAHPREGTRFQKKGHCEEHMPCCLAGSRSSTSMRPCPDALLEACRRASCRQ